MCAVSVRSMPNQLAKVAELQQLQNCGLTRTKDQVRFYLNERYIHVSDRVLMYRALRHCLVWLHAVWCKKGVRKRNRRLFCDYLHRMSSAGVTNWRCRHHNVWRLIMWHWHVIVANLTQIWGAALNCILYKTGRLLMTYMTSLLFHLFWIALRTS